MNSPDAARAIRKGLEKIPGVLCEEAPVSDGGDGLVEVVSRFWKGEKIKTEVEGPLGKKVKAVYFLSGKRAVIEMAEASGIKYLGKGELDCLKASTYGTGQLMKDAFERGAKEIIVGLGGSASSDAGAGCARGFGFGLLDKNGAQIHRGAAGLAVLWKIARPLPGTPSVTALADVDNPLCGERGSARIFGPQKGAGPEEIIFLEKAFARFSRIARRDLGREISRIKGGAAAGGLGAGLYAFFGAKIKNGTRFVFGETGFEKKLKSCDLVITGEGKFDRQSVEGKTFREIAGLARKHSKKIVIICGKNEVGRDKLRRRGVAGVVEILSFAPPEKVFRAPSAWLERAAREGMRELARRSWKVGRPAEKL